jgi:heme oxygenase
MNILLTEELKECTADKHQAAEKKMVSALKKIQTTADYIRMLNWLYGFYGPVEALIRRYLTNDSFPDMIKRSRAEYLLWDIKESGLPEPPPDPCEALPVIDSFHRSLGAETRRMWQSFKDFINRPFTAAQSFEIIAAAEDTFITFKNWIVKHDRQPQS